MMFYCCEVLQRLCDVDRWSVLEGFGVFWSVVEYYGELWRLVKWIKVLSSVVKSFGLL